MNCFDAFQGLCLLEPVYLFAWLMRLIFCGVILAAGAVIFGIPLVGFISGICNMIAEVRKQP